MIVPTLRVLAVASSLWLAGAIGFALSLLGSLWAASPMLGLARGLLFLSLAVTLAAIGAAWAAWLAHGRLPRRDKAAMTDATSPNLERAARL